MLSPLFSQSDFTFSYHKLKITWQFHHYAPRLSARKTNCSWLASFKTCGIRSQMRHCPVKNHSNLQKQRTFLKKQGIYLWKQGTFWNLRPWCLFMLRTRRNYHCSSVIKSKNQFPRAHAYARIYIRVLCFLLSHLSQYFASICKTLRYLGFEGFWPCENPVDCCHTSWRSSEISLSCLLLGRNTLPFLLPFSLRVTEVTAKKQKYQGIYARAWSHTQTKNPLQAKRGKSLTFSF